MNVVQLPREQWSLSYHQWMTCEAYLGHCPQFVGNNNGARQRPSIEEQLARAVATLQRRTEEPNFEPQEAYICVVPRGLQLSIGSSHVPHECHNPQQRMTRTFPTKLIARCTSNHHPCSRMFVWVFDGASIENGIADERGGLECHGVLCHSALDAVRLAHTLKNAFQHGFQSAVIQRGHLMGPSIRRANALPPLPYHPVPQNQLFAEVPLADIAMLPMPSCNTSNSGNSTSVRANEVSRTFAGDLTVALASAPPAYQSRPGSAMSVSARRVASPSLLDDTTDGMTYLD